MKLSNNFRPGAVLIDFDRTIGRLFSGADALAAAQWIRDTLHGDPRLSDDTDPYAVWGSLRKSISQVRGEKQLELQQLELEVRSLLRIRELAQMADGAELYPYSTATLRWLDENGIKVAVVSNNDVTVVEGLLEMWQLDNYVDVVAARTASADVSALKPSPAPILAALAQLRTARDLCLYVGDSEEDGSAALNAAIAFVGVTSGKATSEQLGRYDPVAVVTDLSQLLTLF